MLSLIAESVGFLSTPCIFQRCVDHSCSSKTVFSLRSIMAGGCCQQKLNSIVQGCKRPPLACMASQAAGTSSVNAFREAKLRQVNLVSVRGPDRVLASCLQKNGSRHTLGHSALQGKNCRLLYVSETTLLWEPS